MTRRLKAAFAVPVAFVALIGALTVPTAAPASAVPVDCSIVVASSIAIDRPYKLIPATLGSDCAYSGATWAAWTLRHSYYGPSGMFIFDGTRSTSYALYDWERFGTYYVEPDSAHDASYNDLTQNTRSYVVKAGSRVYVAATRAGSYVTVSASTSYYNPEADTFRPWANERIQLQYRTCSNSTCAWTYLRTVVTTSSGKATLRTLAPRNRSYRAVAAAAPSIWGRTSAAVYR